MCNTVNILRYKSSRMTGVATPLLVLLRTEGASFQVGIVGIPRFKMSWKIMHATFNGVIDCTPFGEFTAVVPPITECASLTILGIMAHNAEVIASGRDLPLKPTPSPHFLFQSQRALVLIHPVNLRSQGCMHGMHTV